MVDFLFVIGWMLVDSIVMQLFPNSYLMEGLMFFSQLGFCAMILEVRNYSLLDSILYAFLYGFIFDFCFAHMNFVHAIIYIFIALMIRVWSKYMDHTIVESIFLAVVMIFTKDVMIYILMNVQRLFRMDFMIWVQRFELKTILIAIFEMMVVYYFYQIKKDYIERKAQALRRGEKIEWFHLKPKK